MILFDVVYWGAASLYSLIAKGPRVVVLYYHSVDTDSPEISINPCLFEKEMAFIADKCVPVSLGAVEAFINSQTKLKDLSVAVTFDDGFKDNYTVAFPILKKYGVPATIFVTTDFVGKSVKYDEGEKPALSWVEIKELVSSGLIEIGSHTNSHPSDLRMLSNNDLKKEIGESKAILEQKLSKQVRYFSYPKGRMNDMTREIVREVGYSLGFSTHWAFTGEGVKRFAVPRVGSSNFDSPVVFKSRLKGGFIVLHQLTRIVGAERR